ncbi:ATP-binding protein [Rheinheimera baltica]|uniref:histidine kinase n=1 Tax=Rheinheimera baltica TaxID=67576 RepID=A0ABT9HYH7_9GAMM|nr:ATP-binding protein [Rheinheimera baltica]MDP5136169.1 ATP-binding protein [Rheinheimera baltica]MDP5190399.1 ATP-binding protein [Rheinheimera baltica]
MTSVRRYLISVLIAVLVLTSFLAALQSYRLSADRAAELFDQDLELVAAAILNQYQMQAPQSGQGLAIQLVQQGKVTYASEQAPRERLKAPEGFSEQNFSGKRWRVYLQHSENNSQVMVAQPLQQRLQLADEVITASIYPVVLSLPFQALLIWLVVSRALRPLHEFSTQLTSRKANELTPVTLTQVPAELKPVLSSTNSLFERLSGAFAREKRFASDVAHELRTPLSVLEITLFNALTHWKQQGMSDKDENMVALQKGVERMRHLIEQIMLLNRTHPDNFQAKTKLLDWAALCRDVVADWYSQLEQKLQQISIEGEEHLEVKADEFALRLLVSNLLGNAIKYTPMHGQIMLTLIHTQDAAVLEVADSGPGIAPEEYQQVFNRFYRVGGDRHHSGAPGSGLGLAIVKDIVMLHNGKISLGKSDFDSGLKVRVELPL